jgi:hypothetical protein
MSKLCIDDLPGGGLQRLPVYRFSAGPPQYSGRAAHLFFSCERLTDRALQSLNTRARYNR